MNERANIYWMTARAWVVENGTEKEKDLLARWVDLRPDSPELRKEIVQRVQEQVGAIRLKKTDIDLQSNCRADIAGENHLELTNPLPSGRAKFVLTLHPKSNEELDRCFAFEIALEKELDGTGIGFVDGNDIGGGEYRIFCYGPKKAPLAEFVENFRAKSGI